ncbi:MAG: type II toxin-antitoxin system VapC family toxin [Chlorobium sp.]|nr:type II toxin-antitoxin system VapC family toxin [Chlorobium sp.]
MNILIDTHYLLWSYLDIDKIKPSIYDELLNDKNTVYYSQASLWEISIKHNLGKIVLNNLTPEDFYAEIENGYFQCKKLENHDLVSFYKLPIEHRDPFDRLLIWQCIQSDFLFASVDGEVEKYKKYGLRVLS